MTYRAPHRHSSVRQRKTTYPKIPLEANRLEPLNMRTWGRHAMLDLLILAVSARESHY